MDFEWYYEEHSSQSDNIAADMVEKPSERSDNMLKKLRSKAGETIAETLIGLLISALALTMLAGAISTAANLITKSETVMKQYYSGMSGLGQPSVTDSMSVTINDGTNDIMLFGNSDPSQTPVSVKYAVNNAFNGKPVIAYCKQD